MIATIAYRMGLCLLIAAFIFVILVYTFDWNEHSKIWRIARFIFKYTFAGFSIFVGIAILIEFL